MAASATYIVNGIRSDGSLIDDLYIVPLKYTDPKQVVVYRNDVVYEDYTISGSAIRLGGNDWQVDDVIKFELAVIVSLDEDMSVFHPGSSIRAQDLNDNFELLRKAVEELKSNP